MYYAQVYSDFSLDLLMIPLYWGFSPLYSPSLFHPSPPHVDQITGLDTYPISNFLKSLGVTVRLKITVQISFPH